MKRSNWSELSMSGIDVITTALVLELVKMIRPILGSVHSAPAQDFQPSDDCR